ncbi:MAG: ABC transporter permease subunit [Firmicutes bacterium]|nr:ABC transporter permease subunit [Bacillota bacterium]
MFEQTLVIFFKEIRNLTRDRKTFIMSMMIPFILVPLILFIIGFSMNSFQNKGMEQIPVAFSNTDNFFYDFCKAQSNIKIVDYNDKDLKLGKIFVYVKVSDDFNLNVSEGNDFDISFHHSDTMKSAISKNLFLQYKDFFKNFCLEIKNYNSKNNTKLTNEQIRKILSQDLEINLDQGTDINLSSVYFNILAPVMLILYSYIGSSSFSSDMTAGEKERGTLEPLLSTNVDRNAIVYGKLAAASSMGIISSLCTGLGLFLYVFLSAGKFVFGISSISILFLITILTSTFFAALNLTIGIYSKSFKETQIYMAPMSIICLLPSYFVYFLDAYSINLFYFSIPILNIACIMKELLSGIINIFHVGIVLIWLLVYILLSTYTISFMFKKEKVIFRV